MSLRCGLVSNKQPRISRDLGCAGPARETLFNRLPNEIVVKILLFAQAPRAHGVSLRFKQLQNEADREIITQIAQEVFETSYENLTRGLPLIYGDSNHSILGKIFQRQEDELIRLLPSNVATRYLWHVPITVRASVEHLVRLENHKKEANLYCRSLIEVFRVIPAPPGRRDIFPNQQMTLKEKAGAINVWMDLNQDLLDGTTKLTTKMPSISEIDAGTNIMPMRIRKMVFPVEISKMTNLQEICIESKQLKVLPWQIGALTKLESLNLRVNSLVKLPNSIGCLEQLTALDLSENPLRELPEGICGLTKLEQLNLGRCPVVSFPENLERLSALQYLQMNDMGLNSFPNNFFELRKLKQLDVSGNKLEVLPQDIQNLSKLIALDISENPIIDPNELNKIERLRKINRLFINYLPLVQLPEFIIRMNNLRCLEVRNCSIFQFPEWIVNMRNLRSIDILENPFDMPMLPGMTVNNVDKCYDLMVDRPFKRVNRREKIKIYKFPDSLE